MKLPFFKPADPDIAAYVLGTPRRWPASTPLDEVPFVVIDAEATGFDLHNDCILSIAAMPVRGARAGIGQHRCWMVYHSHASVTPATRIHAILPSDSSHGTPIARVLREFCEFIQGAVIVGHHVGFDAHMVNVAMRRQFGRGLRNPLVDTARLAMQVGDAFRHTGYANQKPPGLDEVCAHYGIPVWERHTADGDTFATAQLFLMLCGRLRKSLGRPPTLQDLPLTRGPG